MNVEKYKENARRAVDKALDELPPVKDLHIRLGVQTAKADSLQRQVDELSYHMDRIMSGAYQLDNKPHQLFSTLRLAAYSFAEPEQVSEIVRLCDDLYVRISELPKPVTSTDRLKRKITREGFGSYTVEWGGSYGRRTKWYGSLFFAKRFARRLETTSWQAKRKARHQAKMNKVNAKFR